MVLNLVGGLAFYSFLLLPTMFKFDFRRDVHRLSVLKSMPMTPLKVVLGQLAIPVLLTTAFQLAVLATALLIRGFHPGLLLVAIVVLTPFNLFIFGFENLVFIWYPHRMNQEGIQVFLRSILAFTAKGLIFAFTYALAFLWIFTSKSWALRVFPDDPRMGTAIVFSVGMGFAMFSVATMTIKLLARAFRNFDPSCDLAGLD